MARAYKQAAAAAISVLTEPTHFQGSLDHLAAVRHAVDLPVLRKDFVVDEYQLVEARAYGADAVLLIVAALHPALVHDLLDAARDLGLGVLVEVHDEHELDGLDLDRVDVLGANSRDLKTFAVDLDRTGRVFSHFPARVVRVAESGIAGAEDAAAAPRRRRRRFLGRHPPHAAGRPGARARRPPPRDGRRARAPVRRRPHGRGVTATPPRPSRRAGRPDTHDKNKDLRDHPAPRRPHGGGGRGRTFSALSSTLGARATSSPAWRARSSSGCAGPEPVGVFVNESAEAVNARCAEVGFRLAQLHGHETPETCAAVEVPVVKAVSVQHDASSEQVRALVEPYLDVVDFVLLDTHHTSLWGGTGESFNWRVARELGRSVDVFLAGGISAANVAEAIDTMRPYAVDLSSSVEASPGVKDLDKLDAFFDAFRAATADA